MQAHQVRNPWHALVEWWLPWFEPEAEARRNARTEAIRRRSIASRIRAERVVDAYHNADQVTRHER
jgi:hypothetical protein